MPGPSNVKKLKKKQKYTPSTTLSTTPDILPASASPPVLVEPDSAATSPSDFDITFFLEHAKGPEIQRFVEAASETPTGQNLHRLWIRAVEYGEKRGFKKGFRECHEMVTSSRTGNLPSNTPATDTPPISTSPSTIGPFTSENPPDTAAARILAGTVAEYFAHADFTLVTQFLSYLNPQSAGYSLKQLWDRGFAEGHSQGKEEGIREGEEHVDGFTVTDLLKIGYEKGNLYGIVAERGVWETGGHGDHCPCVSPLKTVNISVQTNPTSTGSIHASVQTSPPPAPSPPPPQAPFVWFDPAVQIDSSFFTSDHFLESPPLIWADDIPPPSDTLSQEFSKKPPPRDLTCLRSTSNDPFSSIRHRHKRSSELSGSSAPSRQALYRPPFRRAHRIRSGPRHYASRSTRAGLAFTPPSDDLNWDTDPRLADLSRALTSLGWIRR